MENENKNESRKKRLNIIAKWVQLGCMSATMIMVAAFTDAPLGLIFAAWLCWLIAIII